MELTKEEAVLIRLWRSTDEQGHRSIMAVAKSQEGWHNGLRVIDGNCGVSVTEGEKK